jgi:hypothetical protein
MRLSSFFLATGLVTALPLAAAATPLVISNADFATPIVPAGTFTTDAADSTEHPDPRGGQNGHNFAFCNSYFALCAASTCRPTGRKIKVNVTGGGTASFPEADCTCPIFSGPGIADLSGGNMQGSCEPPIARDGSVGIWSYYAAHSHIAQKITGWIPTGPKAEAPPQICSANLNLGNTLANCFSFACDHQTYTDTGVPIATCHCPIGESLDGTPVAPHTAFVTQAGQGDPKYCAAHPVSGPISTPLP